MKIAHHMLMFGCAYPAKMNFARESNYWFVSISVHVQLYQLLYL